MESLWLPPAGEAELARVIGDHARVLLDQWLDDCDLQVSRDSAQGTGNVFPFRGGNVAATAECLIQLGNHALSGQADPANSDDRTVLDAVARSVLASLAGHFSMAGRDAGDTGDTAWSICDQRAGWCLTLQLCEETLVMLRIAKAETGRVPELTPLSHAIREMPVKLGAHLGVDSITAGELAGLASGDVLIFPRRYNEQLPVCINGVQARAGSIRLSGESGSLTAAIEVKPSMQAKAD